MTANATYMRMEIEEIPDAAQRLLDGSGASLAEAGQRLKQLQPVMVATIARGSSDHAAAFLKYAIELTAGVPVASIGPSIMSIYGRELRLDGCAAISISQSGKSPDIVAMTQSARRNGALTVALTNTAGSPLAESADIAIDLAAGKEQSVAATKSFVSSVIAGLTILAHWTDDEGLSAALTKLPEALRRAVTVVPARGRVRLSRVLGCLHQCRLLPRTTSATFRARRSDSRPKENSICRRSRSMRARPSSRMAFAVSRA